MMKEKRHALVEDFTGHASHRKSLEENTLETSNNHRKTPKNKKPKNNRTQNKDQFTGTDKFEERQDCELFFFDICGNKNSLDAVPSYVSTEIHKQSTATIVDSSNESRSQKKKKKKHSEGTSDVSIIPEAAKDVPDILPLPGKKRKKKKKYADLEIEHTQCNSSSIKTKNDDRLLIDIRDSDCEMMSYSKSEKKKKKKAEKINSGIHIIASTSEEHCTRNINVEKCFGNNVLPENGSLLEDLTTKKNQSENNLSGFLLKAKKKKKRRMNISNEENTETKGKSGIIVDIRDSDYEVYNFTTPSPIKTKKKKHSDKVKNTQISDCNAELSNRSCNDIDAVERDPLNINLVNNVESTSKHKYSSENELLDEVKNDIYFLFKNDDTLNNNLLTDKLEKKKKKKRHVGNETRDINEAGPSDTKPIAIFNNVNDSNSPNKSMELSEKRKSNKIENELLEDIKDDISYLFKKERKKNKNSGTDVDSTPSQKHVLKNDSLNNNLFNDDVELIDQPKKKKKKKRSSGNETSDTNGADIFNNINDDALDNSLNNNMEFTDKRRSSKIESELLEDIKDDISYLFKKKKKKKTDWGNVSRNIADAINDDNDHNSKITSNKNSNHDVLVDIRDSDCEMTILKDTSHKKKKKASKNGCTSDSCLLTDKSTSESTDVAFKSPESHRRKHKKRSIESVEGNSTRTSVELENSVLIDIEDSSEIGDTPVKKKKKRPENKTTEIDADDQSSFISQSAGPSRKKKKPKPDLEDIAPGPETDDLDTSELGNSSFQFDISFLSSTKHDHGSSHRKNKKSLVDADFIVKDEVFYEHDLEDGVVSPKKKHKRRLENELDGDKGLKEKRKKSRSDEYVEESTISLSPSLEEMIGKGQIKKERVVDAGNISGMMCLSDYSNSGKKKKRRKSELESNRVEDVAYKTENDQLPDIIKHKEDDHTMDLENSNIEDTSSTHIAIKSAEDEETDEELKDSIDKLYQLDIIEAMHVAPLHELLTRTTYPTKTQTEEIKRLNLEVKTGPFSKEEDAKILANWKSFCENFDFPMDPRIFVDFPRRTRHKKMQFLRYISQGLDNRLLHRVYIRFKALVLKNELKQGRFSPKEDRQILEYMERTRSHRPYSELAELLSRTRLAIERRHRRLINPVKTIHWTPELIDSFLRRLLKVTKCRGIKELEDRKITLKEWKKVSKKMDQIPVRKLQRAWGNNICPRLFVKEDVDLREIKAKIVKRLIKKGESDWRTVDWKRVAKKFQGFTPSKIYFMFKHLVNFHVPQKIQANLEDTLNYLNENLVKRKSIPATHKFKKIEFNDSTVKEET